MRGPEPKPTAAAVEAIVAASQADDPLVVLRHEDEVLVVVRVAMENRQRFGILTGADEQAGEPVWQHKPIICLGDLSLQS